MSTPPTADSEVGLTPTTPPPPPPDTNQDELIIRQQEAIENEISSTTPFVGPIEPLTVLCDEYRNDAVYLEKITSLSTTYPHLRKMRPDGNCFYRAFSFGILESLIGKPDEIGKFLQRVVSSKELLNQSGFNQFTIDDFYETFVELLTTLSTTPSYTLSTLETTFKEPSLADYLIVYLRILTSAELRKSADFYQNFIEEKTIEEFCQLEVEPMYRESDHIHIIGLTKALGGVGVGVVYMDRGTGASHNFPDESTTPVINMLYRPGHYDIIYKS